MAKGGSGNRFASKHFSTEHIACRLCFVGWGARVRFASCPTSRFLRFKMHLEESWGVTFGGQSGSLFPKSTGLLTRRLRVRIPSGVPERERFLTTRKPRFREIFRVGMRHQRQFGSTARRVSGPEPWHHSVGKRGETNGDFNSGCIDNKKRSGRP